MNAICHLTPAGEPLGAGAVELKQELRAEID